MESRGGEKRAWRRKYPQTEDARLRSGCTGPVSDVVSAFRGPPRRHAEKGLGAKTRAWQPLLVNEDRGSLCNLCNRSRERSERRRHALRFSFLNASSADPRCRFLSSPLRYRRYRLSFYSLSLSLLLLRSNRGGAKHRIPAASFDQPFREARRERIIADGISTLDAGIIRILVARRIRVALPLR